jgi:hypothetical protein
MKIDYNRKVLTVNLHLYAEVSGDVEMFDHPMLTFTPHDTKPNLSTIFTPMSSLCTQCGKCRELTALYNTRPNKYDMHTLAYGKQCSHPVPLSLVYAIGDYVVKCFNERELIPRKNYKNREHYAQHQVSHVNVTDADTVVELSKFKYVYKKSEKYEWKGGHHASPRAHKVHGYYRKSPNGNYILRGSTFVDVGKGNGTHIFVKGFRRGVETGSVQYHNITTD